MDGNGRKCIVNGRKWSKTDSSWTVVMVIHFFFGRFWTFFGILGTVSTKVKMLVIETAEQSASEGRPQIRTLWREKVLGQEKSGKI